MPTELILTRVPTVRPVGVFDTSRIFMRVVEILRFVARALTAEGDRFRFAAATTTDAPDSSNERRSFSSSDVHHLSVRSATANPLLAFNQTGLNTGQFSSSYLLLEGTTSCKRTVFGERSLDRQTPGQVTRQAAASSDSCLAGPAL